MRVELFDVRRWWPRQRTQRDDERGFVNSGILFYCLLFNSSALYYLQTPTRRYGHASTPPQFLPISGNRDVSLPLAWNGLCDRHRAEITVMQFTGHSLPVHHSEVGPSPCPILSAEHTCAISFDYWPLGCVTSPIFGMAGVIVIERK